MQNVYVIRDLVALSVLGHLMYETFFEMFCIHRWNDGYPVVMKNIYFRYDTRCILDCWNLDVTIFLIFL